MTKNELLKKLENNENIDFETTLKGTEKQIIWAEKIRKRMLSKMIEPLKEDFDIFGWDNEDMIEEMEEGLLELLNTDDASLIIAWERN